MNKRIFFIPILFSVLLISCVGSEKRETFRRVLGKTYILNFNVYNSKLETTTVSKNNVVYTKICVDRPIDEAFEYPFASERLFRGDIVTISEITDDFSFVSVVCKAAGREGRVLLKKNWHGDFLPAFRLMFSEQKSFNLPVDVKYSEDKFHTKNDLIRYFGFPLSICKKGKMLIYYYSITFMGYNIGADEIWVEIENGKIIGWSSTI